MLKKILFSCILLCLGFSMASAQDYKSAIGLRLGVPVSISYKLNISDVNAVELVLGTQGRSVLSTYGWRRYVIGGTYLFNNEISALDGLNWYYGAGLTASIWRYTDRIFFEGSNSLSIGIHGSIGLDYKFEDYPVNVSVDWQPGILINGYISGFGVGYGAVSVRYILD